MEQHSKQQIHSPLPFTVFFIFMLVIVTPGTGSVILRLEMKHIPLESVTDKNLSDLTENKA